MRGFNPARRATAASKSTSRWPMAAAGMRAQFLLTTFTINGNQDAAKLTIEVEMQSDGPVTWVDAVALLAA